MKMQFAALALILGSSFVAASDVKFVNADGSTLSTLCITAAESGKPVGHVARELNIPALLVDDVMCNNTPIQRFVTQFRGVNADTTLYVINVGDEKPETRLCLAALTNDEEFQRLKHAHFIGMTVERDIVCNGMSLGQFVRRYQDRLATPQTAATASL